MFPKYSIYTTTDLDRFYSKPTETRQKAKKLIKNPERDKDLLMPRLPMTKGDSIANITYMI